MAAALRSLKERGFAASSARNIAAIAGVNQALVFYHFGGVHQLLLEALDATSSERLDDYREQLRGVSTLPDLIEVMAACYRADVSSGHVTAVQEMVAGACSLPALRREVMARMEPWVTFAEEVLTRIIGGSVVEALIPVRDVAFAAVAFYFGIEMLTHLDGDRSKAEALFRNGRRLAPIGELLLRAAPIAEAP